MAKRKSDKPEAIAGNANDVAELAASVGNETVSTGSETGQSGNSDRIAELENGDGKDAETSGNDRGENAEQAAPIPQKRKRGRPSNAEKAAASGETVDLKEKPAKASKSKVNPVDTVAGLYQTLNNFVAMNANAHAFVIDQKEATTIAEPLVDVLAMWGITLDGVSSPYARLIAAVIGVYGARVLTVYMMKQATKANAPPQAQPGTPAPDTPMGATVVQMQGRLNLA